MTPNEVLERFTEEEMVRMVAYQNLYGPVTPTRFDLLFARLGMDVISPHLKKGAKAELKDHLIEWSRRTRRKKTAREIWQFLKGMKDAQAREEDRRKVHAEPR